MSIDKLWPQVETGRANVGTQRATSTATISWFAQHVPPPGIDLFREQVYRARYARERAETIVTDAGVSWPIDLGEAGA